MKKNPTADKATTLGICACSFMLLTPMAPIGIIGIPAILAARGIRALLDRQDEAKENEIEKESESTSFGDECEVTNYPTALKSEERDEKSDYILLDSIPIKKKISLYESNYLSTSKEDEKKEIYYSTTTYKLNTIRPDENSVFNVKPIYNIHSNEKKEVESFETPILSRIDITNLYSKATGLSYENAYTTLRNSNPQIINKSTDTFSINNICQSAISHGASLSTLCDEISKATGMSYENVFHEYNRIRISRLK